MMVSEKQRVGTRTGRVSLILPVAPGGSLPGWKLAQCRGILEDEGHFESVEVIVAGGAEQAPANGSAKSPALDDAPADRADDVRLAQEDEWSALVRAGLRASTGDHLVVFDVERRYSPDSLRRVVAPLRAGKCDLAVAIPRHDHSLRARWSPSSVVFSLISRLFLGTSDVFSGLFALERSVWDRAGRDGQSAGSSLVLDSLLRRPARCMDVRSPWMISSDRGGLDWATFAPSSICSTPASATILAWFNSAWSAPPGWPSICRRTRYFNGCSHSPTSPPASRPSSGVPGIWPSPRRSRFRLRSSGTSR